MTTGTTTGPDASAPCFENVETRAAGFQPAQDVFPESEKDFFSKVSDDVLTFEMDNHGHVTTMVVHTGGRDIPIKRIEP